MWIDTLYLFSSFRVLLYRRFGELLLVFWHQLLLEKEKTKIPFKIFNIEYM